MALAGPCGGALNWSGFCVHTVDAEGDAGMRTIPVVAGGLERFRCRGGRTLFAAGEKHMGAVEFASTEPGSGEGFVEGSARFEDVHLAAKACGGVLEVGDAEAGPAGAQVSSETAGGKLAQRSRGLRGCSTYHEGGEDSSRLAILFGQSDVSEAARWFFVRGLEVQALQGAELRCRFRVNDADEVEEATLMEPPARTLWPGTSKAATVEDRSPVGAEELPARTRLTSFTYAQGIELLVRMVINEETTGGLPGWTSGEAGGDRVGET